MFCFFFLTQNPCRVCRDYVQIWSLEEIERTTIGQLSVDNIVGQTENAVALSGSMCVFQTDTGNITQALVWHWSVILSASLHASGALLFLKSPLQS